MKIVVPGTRGFPGVQGGVETHRENLYPRLAVHFFRLWSRALQTVFRSLISQEVIHLE